jgi:hypothetical protein
MQSEHRLVRSFTATVSGVLVVVCLFACSCRGDDHFISLELRGLKRTNFLFLCLNRSPVC